LTDRNYAVGYTQTISPRMVNDFHFGYHKSPVFVGEFLHQRIASPARDGPRHPRIHQLHCKPGNSRFEITGFVAIGGQNMTSSNWTRPIHLVWTDVFNYTVGAHSLAMGAEFYRLTTGSQGQNASRGLFNFTGGISGNAAADFLLGEPLNNHLGGHRRAGPGAAVARRVLLSDKWSASKNLTLTIGLRYELPTVAVRRTGHQRAQPRWRDADTHASSLFDSAHNSQRNAFAPRLGFAIGSVINGWYAAVTSLLQRQSDERYTIGGSIRPSPIA